MTSSKITENIPNSGIDRDLATRIFRNLRRLQRAQKAYRELCELNDGMLKDIGLTRSELLRFKPESIFSALSED